MKEKIIFAILISSLVIPSALASVNYQTCLVNNCPLAVTDCSSGSIDIFSSQSCSGAPLFEYTFTSGTLAWFPDSAGTYYMSALCDDGITKSICSQIVVSSSQITTTTSMFEEITTASTSTGGGGGGNSNIIFYVLIIVIIAVIAFFAYRLLTKKKKKIDYETLYRKWGK